MMLGARFSLKATIGRSSPTRQQRITCERGELMCFIILLFRHQIELGDGGQGAVLNFPRGFQLEKACGDGLRQRDSLGLVAVGPGAFGDQKGGVIAVG